MTNNMMVELEYLINRIVPPTSADEASNISRCIESLRQALSAPRIPKGQHLMPSEFLREYLELLDQSDFRAIYKLVRREMVEAILADTPAVQGEPEERKELSKGATHPVHAAVPTVQDEPVYLYRRLGFNDFVTCDFARYIELSGKPDFFETKVLPAALPPVDPSVCRSCNGHGVIGWTTGQTPESFDQGEAPCPECGPQPTKQTPVSDEQKPFNREDRYIVLKSSRLSAKQISTITQLYTDALVAGVFVDKRWPEFEAVWSMIQRRVAGEPTQPDVDVLVAALMACAKANSAAEVGLIVDDALAAHRKGSGQ